MFDTAIAGARSNFLQISNADVANGVFNVRYAQSQRNVAIYGAAVVGGTAAVYAAPAMATGTVAMAGRAGAWAGRNAKNLCVAASLCTLAETPAGNIVIQSSDDVIRALQTRESIRRGIDATNGIRSIGGP
jgi:hypothetical protein